MVTEGRLGGGPMVPVGRLGGGQTFAGRVVGLNANRADS